MNEINCRFCRHFFFGIIAVWIAGQFLSISICNAQTPAREILKRAAEAAGGIARFESLRNFRITTESEIHMESGAITATITETVELPDKTIQSIELKNGTRVQVLNGNSGSALIGGEKSSLNASELREMRRGLFRDSRYLYARCNDPNLTVQYIDDRNVSGERVAVIRVVDQTGDFVDLYIDLVSSLLRRKSYRGGAEVELATLVEEYSDYKDFTGIKLPLLTRVTANGKLFLRSRILKAEFNLELAKDYFSN